MNDADHPLDLLGRDGAGAGLFPQQVHHVGRELLAPLRIRNNVPVRYLGDTDADPEFLFEAGPDPQLN